MLHVKIVDTKNEKIKISKAEKFISSSKFGASIYFCGTVRDNNDNKNVTVGQTGGRNVIYLMSFQGFIFEVVYTSKKIMKI